MSMTLLAAELRALLRGARPLMLLMFCLICAGSLLAQFVSITKMRTANAALSAKIEGGMAEWRHTLKKIEEGQAAPSPYAARPMDVAVPAILEPINVGMLAAGRRDLHPASTTLSPWRNSVNLFAEYEISNPSISFIGPFDLAFVSIVVAPLFLIALVFDALAGERAQGTLRLILLQPVSARAIGLVRVISRAGIVWAIVLVASVIGTLVGGGPGSAHRLLLWCAGVVAYGAFWIGLCLVVVAIARRPETAAGALVAVWAVVVFAAPAILASATETVYPPPSRLAYLSEMRAAQVEANRNADQLTREFLVDHPELTVADENLTAYYEQAYLANLEVERRTEPTLAKFEASRAARNDVAEKWGILSPAILAQRLLYLSAGADAARQFQFQSQARQRLAELSALVGPSVVARQRISLQEINDFAPFQFEDRQFRDLVTDAAPSIALLLLYGFALGLIGLRLLSRHPERLL